MKKPLIIPHGLTTNAPIIIDASIGTLFDVLGDSGQLFSVTDDLTGDIFEVSDITGIPILVVNSDGIVTVDNLLEKNSADASITKR